MHAETSRVLPQHSTASHNDDSIATTLRFGYGLRLLSAPTLLHEQNSAERYLCSTNAGRFVLRCYAANTNVAALARSIELVESLANSGFAVAAPLRAHDGEITVVLGRCPAAVYHVVEGEPLAASNRDIRDQGLAIGCMHRLYGFEDDGSLSRVLPRVSVQARLEQVLWAGLTHSQIACGEALRERASYLQLPPTLGQGVVHGSLGPEQLVRSAEGEVALCDGDVLAYGPQLLDIALLIARVCMQPSGAIEQLALCELIAGYSQGMRRKLWLDEWQALPLLTYYATLGLAADQLRVSSANGDHTLPAAWELAQAIEAGWGNLTNTLTTLAMDQLAPERDL